MVRSSRVRRRTPNSPPDSNLAPSGNGTRMAATGHFLIQLIGLPQRPNAPKNAPAERTGVLLHVDNLPRHSEGCILLGPGRSRVLPPHLARMNVCSGDAPFRVGRLRYRTRPPYSGQPRPDCSLERRWGRRDLVIKRVWRLSEARSGGVDLDHVDRVAVRRIDANRVRHVVGVQPPLKWMTSNIAFGTQGVPGPLPGDRVKPAALST